MRQALGGLLWTKQFYHYDVRRWLEGDPTQPPPPPERRRGRNREWTHLYNSDVISMPDKWEYPWYAAWDLAFHCLPLALVDPDFAKEQLVLLLREWYMHPNGQLPAYEWAFSDVNPPVHAWAAWRVYKIDKRLRGTADRTFLERVFHKRLLNCTWWVNRKDAEGLNIFQGGSSASTISASSTGRHPCPPAATSSSPTARAGWACIASTCSRWRSSWPTRIAPTRTWRASSSSTSSTSRAPRTTAAARASACGTRPTASSTTCCTCPTAGCSRSPCGRWWG